MFRIRIIPATITTAMLLLCVKVIDISHITEALAQDPAPPATSSGGAAPAAPTPAAPTTPAGGAAPAAPAASSSSGGGATPVGATVAASSATGVKAGKADPKDPKNNPNVSDSSGDTVNNRYTPTEIDLLQNLTARREELDHWEKNIEIKEAALNATEKRIDDKITQIDNMKKEVAALLVLYNEKEDAKIRSLVKIYQGMKPKEAARIFDELDMPVLLLVVDKMPEKNTAPILALMDPKKAKQITVQLAEQRKMGGQKTLDAVPAAK